MSGNWVMDTGITLDSYPSNLTTTSDLPRNIIVNGDTIRLVQTRAPTLPNSPGLPGEICWDDNFLYLHTGNVWRKIPLINLV